MSVPVKAMRDALLQRIYEEMGCNDRIFFLSADFGSPVLDKIRDDFPERFINVGIAEQNLINVAAGLALEGFTVFAYAIAPFITMRCYEQVRVNLALLSEVRDMNVNLIGVGAGFSYVVSGPTHQCYEDLSIMRTLPNIQVLSPADWVSARALVPQCVGQQGITYLRLDAQPLAALYDEGAEIDVARGYTPFVEGEEVALVSTGFMSQVASNVVQRLADDGVRIGWIDVFDLSRINRQGLADELGKYRAVVSVEEGFRGCGGLDAMLFSLIVDYGMSVRLTNSGLEQRYQFELGSRVEHHEAAGIGEKALTEKIKGLLVPRG